jgi:hypothetical protein
MPFKLKAAVLAVTTALAGLVAVAPALAASPTPLGSMPTGTLTVHHTSGHAISIGLSAFGLTPGSSHKVGLSTALCAASTGGSGVHVVQADGSGQLSAHFNVRGHRARNAASVSLMLGTPGASGGGVSPTTVIACANIPDRCRAPHGCR